MEDISWLNTPVHTNHIKIEITDSMKDNLVVSFDGTILGVKTKAIESYLSEDEVKMVRVGFKKLSKDMMKYDSEDGLYRMLSYIVEL